MSYIERLRVDGFRNLKGIDIQFAPGMNIVSGPNGAGKSNLLEAIHYLLYLRSFRNVPDSELIGDGGDGFSIEGSGGGHQASVRLHDGTKKVLLNGVKRSRYSEYAGWLNCVIFSLSDLWLVIGAPSYRRHWLDSLIIRLKPETYRTFLEFRTVLKQRNQLLIRGGDSPQFEVWTEQLIEIGKRIYQFRGQIFPEMKAEFNRIASEIGLEIDITYHPVTTPETFAADLQKVKTREIELRKTIIGPHRDDIIIAKDGRDIRGYGSTGEQRIGAIILRFVEGNLLKKRGTEPILLFDEPFIEIDPNYRERVEDFLTGQSIIATTTELSGEKIFRIERGRIEVAD